MNLNKYFICSDIHAYYSIWQQKLIQAGFDINNSNHFIILLGDLLDGGPEPKECLKFVCDLIDKNRIVTIKGNHELMMEQTIKRNGLSALDDYNGIYQTMVFLNDLEGIEPESIVISKMKQNNDWNKYFNNLIYYYETNNYILVHSWIPCFTDRFGYKARTFTLNPDWKNATNREWKSALWYDNWRATSAKPSKKIICGHCDTELWRNILNLPPENHNILEYNNIIVIDANVRKNHRKINILTLDNM